MKNIGFLFVFCLIALQSEAQKITQITGFAPQYIGKEVVVYQIADYLSMKQERIASATVNEDSTFTCSFYLEETRKLIITSANNKGMMLASPGVSYEIYLPDRNPYDPYRPAGNEVEISFNQLPATDINYRVLEMDRWADEFVTRYYTENNAKSKYFAQRLDSFKTNVAAYYKNDTLDPYFNYHRKFTIARLDDLRFLGSRNQYEKYDFYIRNTPVNYQSEAYMEYINHYYEKFLQHVDPAINNEIYSGILKSSPTKISRAMAKEYTMKHNLKLRELVMIKMLSEAFYDKDYPQTNIISILDSVSKYGGFKENRLVAGAILERLTQLAIGGKAPNFMIIDNGKVHDLHTIEGKHTYLIFVTASNKEELKQLELLVPLYTKYSAFVQFLMIVKDDGKLTENELSTFKLNYPWETVIVTESHAVLQSYQVKTTPSYDLLDAAGYIIGAPALGPLPNGQYETIDKTFFALKKATENGSGQ
jgi:hypothetical protein